VFVGVIVLFRPGACLCVRLDAPVGSMPAAISIMKVVIGPRLTVAIDGAVVIGVPTGVAGMLRRVLVYLVDRRDIRRCVGLRCRAEDVAKGVILADESRKFSERIRGSGRHG